MSNLRKIGTIVEHEFPPTFSGTDTCYWRTITYRVKEHVRVARFTGDKAGEMAEGLQVVDIKEFHARQLHFPGNQMIWEKGEALRGGEEK